MARNEVPLTLSSNKDILRPLYICKTNLFWSVIKTSLQQQLPVLLVGTQLHAKLPLSVRIANLFLVKCGWYGLPPPPPPSHNLSPVFHKKYLPCFLSSTFFLRWSFRPFHTPPLHPPTPEGERRKRKKCDDIFSTEVFHPIPPGLVHKITPIPFCPKIQASIYTALVSHCLHNTFSSWKQHQISSSFCQWEFPQEFH